LLGSRSSNVAALAVVGSRGSLKTALIGSVVLTSVAPVVGETELTVGGVVSAPIVVLKTTSTQ